MGQAEILDDLKQVHLRLMMRFNGARRIEDLTELSLAIDANAQLLLQWEARQTIEKSDLLSDYNWALENAARNARAGLRDEFWRGCAQSYGKLLGYDYKRVCAELDTARGRERSAVNGN